VENVELEQVAARETIRRTVCLSCGAGGLHDIVSLGMMPLANAYPELTATGEEPRFPLDLAVCPGCSLVQIRNVVPPEAMFSEYLYFTSYSASMLRHSEALARMLIAERGLGPDSLVVEVASNDGYLLKEFADLGVPVLGLEHLKASAEAALALGVPTEQERFGTASAARLAAEGRRADAVISNHNLANAGDLDDYASALELLLAPGGMVAVEFHHVLELIVEGQFDVISHSHCCYLSLLTLQQVFERRGLTLVDAERLPVHGGSVRAYARRTSEGPVAGPGVERVLQAEHAAGLGQVTTYEGFTERVTEVQRLLIEGLRAWHREGLRAAAYGAPAKGNTLLNSCGGVGPT
jgi:C-methyltransferase C-terminal domain/Putative zinc binding domain/Methyltransferase domain